MNLRERNLRKNSLAGRPLLVFTTRFLNDGSIGVEALLNDIDRNPKIATIRLSAFRVSFTSYLGQFASS